MKILNRVLLSTAPQTPVPKVSFQKACINPGDVLNQSPQAGNTVPPGSTINLSVDSGTFKTCIIK
jgi:beta-lactam-binding protein with PASTA domain